MKSFVSAPTNTPLGGLRQALGSLDIDVADAGSISPGTDWTSWLRDEMSACDLIVVVLPETEPDPPAFLLEIGVAIGLGKRLLVIMPEDRRPPPGLEGIQYLRAHVNDVAAITLHLRAALQSAPATTLEAEPGRRATAMPELAAWLENSLSALEAQPAGVRGRVLENLVERLFRESGGFVEESPSPGSGPDLAVLFAEPSPVSGPLLVEVKGQSDRRRLEQGALQLQQWVLDRGAALGVLMYRGTRRQEPLRSLPRIVAVDLDELPGELRTRSLAEVLAAARNRAIHEM